MHPLAEDLAHQFISDFWAQNHSLTWTAVETERSLWLSPNTLLIGRVDAEGLTGDSFPFFGEWKTASASKARRMIEEKAKFRREPQCLTYPVLLGPKYDRFLVRWALKTKPCSTDFEWYTYTPAEVEHWRGQLLGIADEIRTWRKQNGIWRTNFTNCYRYGVAYACPFLAYCPFGRDAAPVSPRTPHLALERAMDRSNPDLVVLDASRVHDYLECPEKYNRIWEGVGHQEETEALIVGTDFHSLVGSHLKTLIKLDKTATPDGE